MSYGIGRTAAVPLFREVRLTGMVEVQTENAAEIDASLEEAIKVVTLAAEHHHMGILVTRIQSGRYVVRAHPLVPAGLVREG